MDVHEEQKDGNELCVRRAEVPPQPVFGGVIDITSTFASIFVFAYAFAYAFACASASA